MKLVPNEEEKPQQDVSAKPSHHTDRSEEPNARIRVPKKHNKEMFAIADQLMGGSRIHVICEDGKSRLARIPGKMKRRARVRSGDLLIIVPWDIQDGKADVLYRYTRTQAVTLSRRNLLPTEIDVF